MNNKRSKLLIYPNIIPSQNPEESIKFLYIFQNNNFNLDTTKIRKSILIQSGDYFINNFNENKEDLIELIVDLQKGKKKRGNIIKKIISEFISKTELYNKIRKNEIESYENFIQKSNENNNSNEISMDEMIFSKIQDKINLLVDHITFEKRQKGDFLIKLNDKINYVYILVVGRLSLLKPIELKNYQFTYEEYIEYLMELKIKKENHLLERILKLNFQNLPIESLNIFKKFIKVYFQIKINKELKDKTITFHQIEDYFNKYQLKFEDLDLNKEEMQQKYVKSLKYQNNNQWIDYIKKAFKVSNVNINFFTPFQFIFNYKDHKLNFNIFRYENISYLKPGNYYGDDKEENLKNNCIRVEEDSVIAYLSKDIFIDILSETSKKEKMKELLFIWKHFIFNKISPLIFEKYYFSLFQICEFKRGDFLYEQESPISYLYLIKEGQVRFYFYGNMIDIFNKIKFCIDRLIEVNPLELPMNELNQLKDLYLNDPELGKIKRKDYLFKDEVHKIKKFEICIIDNYDFFSLDEFFLSKIHLTTCKVYTEKAKFYRINLNDFRKIIKEERIIRSNYYNLVYNKVVAFIKRLFNLKKNIISMAHYKIQLINKEFKDNYLNDAEKKNLSQHQYLIYQNEEIYKNTNWSPFILQNEKKSIKLNQGKNLSQEITNNSLNLNNNNSKIFSNESIPNNNKSAYFLNQNNKNDSRNHGDIKFSNIRLKEIRKEILKQKNIKTIIKLNNNYVHLDSIQKKLEKQPKFLFQNEEKKDIIGVNLLELNKDKSYPKIINNSGFIGFKPTKIIKRKKEKKTMKDILKDISKTFNKNLEKNSPQKILVNTVRSYYKSFQNYSNVLCLKNNKFLRSNSSKNIKNKSLINNN